MNEYRYEILCNHVRPCGEMTDFTSIVDCNMNRQINVKCCSTTWTCI